MGVIAGEFPTPPGGPPLLPELPPPEPPALNAMFGALLPKDPVSLVKSGEPDPCLCP